MILQILVGQSSSTVPKFSAQILKKNYEKTLKIVLDNLQGQSKFRIFAWVTNYENIYQLLRNLDVFL